MQLSQSLSRALNVRHGEWRAVLLLLVHSFCIGIVCTFLETAVSALFLAKFDATVLPYVCIVTSVVATATGLAFSYVKERAGFRALVSSILASLFLSVAAIRLVLSISEASWILFAGMLWYRVISMLIDFEFSSAAGRIFDVRQAKRLFGLVGTG